MAQIKRERGDAIRQHKPDEDDKNKCKMNSSGISITPSESTQSCIKFEKCVYRTLMNLNNEMSSALCGGVKDINNVCFKIMECLHDMEKQEKLYQKMRQHNSSDVLPFLPVLLAKSPVASNTTMTSHTSMCDTKTLQVAPDELQLIKTQSVETIATNVDQVVQCSFACDVSKEFAETQSMQEAFKQCLEAFIKDVEEVSVAYLEEMRKTQNDAVFDEKIEVVQNNEKIDGYVCKCKAVHNLHERLIKQVEACDSFCEFQRKMAKNLALINGKKVPSSRSFCCYHKRLQKTADRAVKAAQKKSETQQPQPPPQQQQQQQKKNLASKYNDSLWFTWMPKHKEKKQRPHKHKHQWKKPKVESPPTPTPPPPPPPPEKKIDDEPPKPSTPPSRGDTSALLLTRGSNMLNCVDILEELTDRDVEPIQSEYPRRDDIKPVVVPSVQNSFLYQMVYGRNNRNVLEILSSLEPPRINCNTCERPSMKVGDKFATRKQSATVTPSSTTTTTGGGKKVGSKSGQKRTVKRHKAQRPQSKSASDYSSDSRTSTQRKASENKVVSRLQRYINDPHLRYRTTITVMPVRVFHQQNPVSKVTFHQTFGDHENNNNNKTIPTNNKSASSRKFTTTPTTTPRDIMPLNARKLWANKYQKSVCQHLVSFVERQEPHPLMVDSPKKPPSKWKILSNNKSQQPSPRLGGVKKVEVAIGVGEEGVKNDDVVMVMPPPPPPTSTKMLSSMGVLASIDRSCLEANLQKIIDMIELKIIDIVSDPIKQNAHAFAEIEREITDVLKQMRSMGTSQQVRKIRRENLKLTALETILDLEVIGNSVVNLLKPITTPDLVATSEESVEERCVITSACAPEKPPTADLATVSSQEFLTPFMQDLKNHRKGACAADKKASYHNIIEFLDNLSMMTDDCAILMCYRDLQQRAIVYQQAHVIYLKDIVCTLQLFNVCVSETSQTVPPTEMGIQTQHQKRDSRTVLVQSYQLADFTANVAQKLTDVETQHNQLADNELICIRTQGHKNLLDKNEIDVDRAKYLNQFYGLLFTLMYFALTFDYECA